MKSYRLPSFGTVERNDVVVFNYPAERDFEDYNKRSDGAFHPLDLKTHYIKRAVAIAGETLEIRETQVYVNGEKAENPPLMQQVYFVKTKEVIRDRIFEKYNIDPSNIERKIPNGYFIHLPPTVAEQLKTLPFIASDSSNN